MSGMLCKNCGKPIAKLVPRLDIWYHIKNAKVDCRKQLLRNPTKAAPPETKVQS